MRQSDRVYQQLHEDILEWRLPPGATLNEVELAERLAISRTPLREAIQRLAHEGLVNAVRGRSARVAEISPDTVVKLFQMREALETYAVRLCVRLDDRSAFAEMCTEFEAQREAMHAGDVTDDYAAYYALIGRFDDAIDLGADNPYLLSTLRDLRGHLHRLRRIARQRPERMATTTEEHLAICQAIRDGDDARAAVATTTHIGNSLRTILTALMENVAGPALLGPSTPRPPEASS